MRFASPKQSERPNGMTAHVTSTGNTERIGARPWRTLSPFGGMKSSFQTILIVSAIAWSVPARRMPILPSGTLAAE